MEKIKKVRRSPYKAFLWGLLLPLGALIMKLAFRFPQGAQRVYTHKIYRFLAGVIARITSLVPFSLSEVMVGFLVLGILFMVLSTIYHGVKGTLPWRKLFLTLVSYLVALASILYFLFVVLCGINYARPSLAEQGPWDVRPSTTEELEALCLELILETNRKRLPTTSHPDGHFEFSADSSFALAKQAQREYTKAVENLPSPLMYVARPKPVMLSKGMSYLDITGVYFPFTFESNVNVHSPSVLIPATMFHELSHGQGYMDEADANFLAYYLSRDSTNPDFSYSGHFLALTHALNAYYQAAGSEAYGEMVERLSPDVYADIAYNAAYWREFATPIAETSRKVNNAYLKSHKQEDGIANYGKMVDLLLADYRLRHGID